MRFRILFFCLWASFFSFAQQTPENTKTPTPYPVSTHPFDYKGRQLIVGQALGKLEKEYRLLEDGGVYRRVNTVGEFEVLGEQSKKNIETAFKSLDDVGFEKINFQHPSRESYFIIFKNGKKEHKVIWGDPKHPAPEGVKRVYRAFMGMIPQSMRL
ncbi:MAG: hypothetical protein ACK4GN_06060 [Runella sp.]